MPRQGLRSYIVAGLVLAGVGLVGGGAFIASGLYNVSAARDHIDVTTWILDIVRRQSVRTHSMGIDPPPLKDAGLVQLGARYFEAGCAPCHGAPGRPASAVRTAMLPAPPPLVGSVHSWSPAELHWIVQNGQKYTGMPSWIAPKREDEVWSVVAFLLQLPDLDEAAYAELAALDGQGDPEPFLADAEPPMPLCVSCHGGPDGLPVHESVPLLGGQHAEYLARSLRDYASGARESGMMQLFATDLSENDIVALAEAYAAGEPAVAAPAEPAGNIATGSAIYELGIPEQGVPACATCHSPGKSERFPVLAGQSATYVHQQLANWKEGLRRAGPYAPIMALIAERLTEGQAQDVAAYVDTLPPARRHAP